MPIPSIRAEENKDEFIQRCMRNSTMLTEYPPAYQRYAVCVSKSKENVFKK